MILTWRGMVCRLQYLYNVFLNVRAGKYITSPKNILKTQNLIERLAT
jgi:hypothetical protein